MPFTRLSLEVAADIVGAIRRDPNVSPAFAAELAPAMWTQAEAVALCCEIEAICPHYGAHVALTGGTLYKDGPRKDADILFYRIRQIERIDADGLLGALEARLGVVVLKDCSWCVKATYAGKPLDMFFPERDGEEYPGEQEAPSLLKPEGALEEEVAF